MERNPTWQCVVAAAIGDGQGRWLMHRRPVHKHHGGLWEFPGGKVETGETPVNALVREIAEELAIAIDPAALVPASFAEEPPGGPEPSIVILLYSAGRWRGNPRALESGAEIDWFTPPEIATLSRPPLDVALCSKLFAEGLR